MTGSKPEDQGWTLDRTIHECTLFARSMGCYERPEVSEEPNKQTQSVAGPIVRYHGDDHTEIDPIEDLIDEIFIDKGTYIFGVSRKVKVPPQTPSGYAGVPADVSEEWVVDVSGMTPTGVLIDDVANIAEADPRAASAAIVEYIIPIGSRDPRSEPL